MKKKNLLRSSNDKEQSLKDFKGPKIILKRAQVAKNNL